jgi:hypothetical protein
MLKNLLQNKGNSKSGKIDFHPPELGVNVPIGWSEFDRYLYCVQD